MSVLGKTGDAPALEFIGESGDGVDNFGNSPGVAAFWAWMAEHEMSRNNTRRGNCLPKLIFTLLIAKANKE